MSQSSKLEDQFLAAWKEYAPTMPEPTREWRFHPTRKWRFDFAWGNPLVVAVEIEGASWSGGRHSRGGGMAKDAEKYNAATILGWKVLRFTGPMLKQDAQGCVEQVLEAMGVFGETAVTQ